jgi:glycosyltransferase-like protein
MWGLFTGDLAAVTEKAGAILGLGPGLTPSCDDFLAGLLMSLGFAGKAFSTDERAARFFKKAGDAIYRLSKQKTTIYSRGLIDDARHGEGPRAAISLIKCLVTTRRYGHGGEDLIMGATRGRMAVEYCGWYLVSRLETGRYEIAWRGAPHIRPSPGRRIHTLPHESLARLGHAVRDIALRGNFFRTCAPATHTVSEKECAGMDKKIRTYKYIYRISILARLHDIFHAEDCISANALLNLRERGLIGSFARTVHHIDDFTSESLIECQMKSILEPDYVITVSNAWEKELSSAYSIRSTVIRNGVDTRRFRPLADEDSKETYKEKFSLGGSRVMLSIGGIEPRKNTMTSLRAFHKARSHFQRRGERLVWVIGGGETLFDYRAYREEFFSGAERLGLSVGKDIFIPGSVSEDAVADLYNAADVFVFPSVKEGWGLVVLEALASGVPVIASGIEPMTEYLSDRENSLLVSPMDDRSS